jgi:acetamidase/formamidase
MITPAHTVHAGQCHSGWDRELAPVLTVSPGETVSMEISDASGGQLDPSSPAAALTTFDMGKINPTTGPIYVEGAKPGDALRIRIDELHPSGWGWTGIIPDFGLLAEDFPEPALHHWNYDASGREPADFLGLARIPLRPFPGTIGLAPAEPGPHSVIPPRRVGGNLDTRDLTAGSTIWLPVEVEGALFSLGDTHAAQGDGEVCGTAIESPMTVVVTLDVEAGAGPAFPVYETVTAPRHNDLLDGVLATTGIGPDLHSGAKDAVRAMVELLGMRYGLDPDDAYMLCSVAADLKISEIVDAPNWVVSCAVPKAILVG